MPNQPGNNLRMPYIFVLNCVSLYAFIFKMMEFTNIHFNFMKDHNNSIFVQYKCISIEIVREGLMKFKEVLRNNRKEQLHVSDSLFHDAFNRKTSRCSQRDSVCFLFLFVFFLSVFIFYYYLFLWILLFN